MPSVREAAVAGQFYPGSASELEATVRHFLADAEKKAGAAVPKAVIAPHAGYVYSGAVAASVYALLQPAAGIIKRVVLLGPCHRVPVRGLALSGADAFATPLSQVPVDKQAAAEILDLPQVSVFEATHAQEHSLEVHLPFLQVILDDFAVIPLVVGEAPPEDVAEVLEALWGGPETLIVVSSDLSHFLDYDSAQKIDSETCRAIENLDGAAISRDGACGRFPVGGLLELAKRRGLTVTTLDVRNSGDTAGPKNRVVGYGSWMFQEAPKGKKASKVTITWDKPEKTGEADESDEQAFAAATQALLDRHGETLLALAGRSIRHGLDHAKPLPAGPADYDAELAEHGACFVTLKRKGRLRGCIGTAEAKRALVVDVSENSFRAAFKDPRFSALKPDEVPGLELSLSVLSRQLPMTFSSEEEFMGQLRPGADGLVIEDGKHRALFLPSVWSQLPDAQVFVEHLKAKAGLAKDHWSGTFKARRFAALEISAAELDDPASIWSDDN
jgi:AmmeMemoRadiSam system protein B/AmmeMemoRadiSam system protein A